MAVAGVVRSHQWIALGLAAGILAVAWGPGGGAGLVVLLLMNALPCVLWPDVSSHGAGAGACLAG